jgi:hypothetical protein
MKLGRLATLQFSGAPDPIPPYSMKIGDCNIDVLLHKPNALGDLLCIAARIELKYLPKITGESLIVIPEKNRFFAEDCICHYAHLTALERAQPVDITSASPSIFLEPDKSDDEDFLRRAIDFKYPTQNRSFPQAEHKIDLRAEIYSDRLDGAALLAQSLKSNRPSADFMSHMRLFERAFAKPNGLLSQPLSSFLLNAKSQGYTFAEVEKWTRARDAVSHADRRSQGVALDSDIMWLLGRVKQAAYDVLTNNKTWGSPDAARRSVWAPTSGTCDSNAGLLATRGKDFSISMQIFDEFRRFPLNLQGNLTALPLNWWAGQRYKSLKASKGQETGN